MTNEIITFESSKYKKENIPGKGICLVPYKEPIIKLKIGSIIKCTYKISGPLKWTLLLIFNIEAKSSYQFFNIDIHNRGILTTREPLNSIEEAHNWLIENCGSYEILDKFPND